jgi:ribosomal protein S18 acetylase RimI-like enzyme
LDRQPTPVEITASGMKISTANQVNEELMAAVKRLVPQLLPSAPVPDAAALKQLLASPHTVLFVARPTPPNDRIVGCLVLTMFRILTGAGAWIDDVVVDSEHRNQGIGTALLSAALEHAGKAGARKVNLTSNPARTAAHRLYRRLGFTQLDTMVFRYEFKKGG